MAPAFVITCVKCLLIKLNAKRDLPIHPVLLEIRMFHLGPENQQTSNRSIFYRCYKYVIISMFKALLVSISQLWKWETSWSRGQHCLLNKPTTNPLFRLITIHNNIKLSATGFWNKECTYVKFCFIIFIISLIIKRLN